MKRINDLTPIQSKQLLNVVASVLQRSSLYDTPTENIPVELAEYFESIQVEAPQELLTYSLLDSCYRNDLTVDVDRVQALVENATFNQWWNSLSEIEQYNYDHTTMQTKHDYFTSLNLN
jgi:hypothetical protein